MMNSRDADVIVVGGGNAGFSAAHAAAERGRSVLVLEKASQESSGGNSYYTAGATRISHNGLDDLRDILDEDERHRVTEVPPYTEQDYTGDMERVTEGRNDSELTRVLVSESNGAVRWLHSLGMKYRLMYERQAYDRPDGTYLFWGGLHVGNTGGGEGLIADHVAIAERLGEKVLYDCNVVDLVAENERIVGVRVDAGGETREYRAESIILAAGGFEANVAMREKYLGEGWGHAKLRGTPCNTGTLIEAGLKAGADRAGDWGSAHSVQWDALTPNNESNRELTNRLTRGGYPFGIIVNKDGARFVDEGEDFRNYTYAKFGREILKQPGNVGYQVFDAKSRPLLRSEEYEMPAISEFTADTLEGVAEAAGIDVEGFTRTVTEFNANIDESRPFDPTIRDLRSSSVQPTKSNWASAIDTAPFYVYPVTCGVTFTFGGLKSDVDGHVLDESGNRIEGLFVCGEMLGGLFSNNYPGGSGLAAGMVFGRRAGSHA
ncbi:FAD-dependent tricarballylate dehydrogenase TcuA [Paramicrobacterium chengjingii]|uniref:FAD-dependent tricarballylate dehydrogenase TcuA n=1 Tax=Paramicrobacterium chengjingii TaxID=2769067 RepID=A0ABX6YJ34_9MICO|nr:FAD-dependent tricarballylate dehydrogenase TcuA [Microbacterium chengjingii]QPZ38416.1 FAD-dependent tricarballylate dehydrogenase TcuA [Microbacterium chengjingii]